MGFIPLSGNNGADFSPWQIDLQVVPEQYHSELLIWLWQNFQSAGLLPLSLLQIFVFYWFKILSNEIIRFIIQSERLILFRNQSFAHQ